VDLIQELNPSYIFLLREVLSERLIEEKLSKVNYKVNKKLRNEDNLTLD